jgi:hypothetical protein
MHSTFSVGLDLGDAESCIAICSLESAFPPQVESKRATPTVIAFVRGKARARRRLIGVEALATEEAQSLRLSFKAAPTKDSIDRWGEDFGRDLLAFAEELWARQTAEYSTEVTRENTQLVVGCPAAWSADAVDRYRALFESSSMLPAEVMVVPESRSALVQAWVTRPELRNSLLAEPVVVIDLGSSTIDVTTINGGVPVEDPSSCELGLFEIDEALCEALVERKPDLESRFRTWPSNYEQTLYLCRLRKEHSCGRRDAPDLARRLTRQKPWAEECWELLVGIDVAEVFGDPLDESSWLGRFSVVIADVAGRWAPKHPIVIVTGGGVAVPQVREVVSAAFQGCRVEAIERPDLLVACGLADYGRLRLNSTRFVTKVMDRLSTEGYTRKLQDAYPAFYQRLASYYIREQTEAVWRPMSRLWASGELRLAERGDFKEYVLSLFRAWIESDQGRERYLVLMRALNEHITDVVTEAIDEVRIDPPLQIGPFRPDVQLPLEDLFRPSSPAAEALSSVLWAIQAVGFRALDRLPLPARRIAGGSFMELALQVEDKQRALLASLFNVGASSVPDTVPGLMQEYVLNGIRMSLNASLEEISRLLMEAHRDPA